MTCVPRLTVRVPSTRAADEAAVLAREHNSVRFQERMELIEAVKKQDVEKVEVRRLLEAFLSTESGPSRGVCLGLGQWTLDAVVARPIRPCCVESSPYVRHQSGNLDAACRRSSVPVWTSRSVTRTLPCRLAESHNFSPPPSPAIAVSATLRSLARWMDARAGCEMASTPSPLGVLSIVNGYPNHSRPSGRACCFVFGYRFGYWGSPVGPTPAHPAPPCTAMAGPRCTGRRTAAIAESSDRSPHPAPS